MPPQACPTREQLSGYVSGILPEDVESAVAEHTETCISCETVVEELERHGDSMLASLRHPVPPIQGLDSPEYHRAVQAAVAVGPQRRVAGTPLPAEDPSGAGRGLGQLGEYKLLAKLGEGGMGVVYKAHHTRLDKTVALKVLPKHRTADPSAVARFEREMKAVGRLDHPHIVRAMDARDIDGTTVLVMEYVDGLDLSALVARLGPLPVADACEVLRQTALGLQCAHDSGLVHRDVKPQNLMLTRQGQVKILDLGLALLGNDPPSTGEVAHAAGGELSSAVQIMGTVNYMAPEQVSDAHAVDGRADVYAMGCTLYKLLAGHAPFSGPQYQTDAQKMAGHLHGTPLPIRLLRPEAPEAVAAALDRMMAKDPAARFAIPAEIAAALRPFAAAADLKRLAAKAAAPPGAATAEMLPDSLASPFRVATLGVEAGGDGQAGGAPRRKSYRWPHLLLAAAAALACLGIVLALRTGAGTLVLEVEPEDVRVEIDGAEVHLTSPRDDVRVAVGEHELTVKKDGFVTRTQTFQIRRNGKTEIAVRLAAARKVLLEDDFQGAAIDGTQWDAGQSSLHARRGSGSTSHRTAQEHGALRLEAKADHEDGWSCGQWVWVDSVQDLRTTDDLEVEIDWSAEANVGSAAIELTDGAAPDRPGAARAVRLLSLSGEKFAPLISRRQRVWIEVCGAAQTATVRTPEGIPRGGAAIALGGIPVWKLRFLAAAATSAGLPPSRVAVQLHRVCVTRMPPRASVSGRVIDDVANRGIPGGTVRFGNDQVITNPDGSFVLPTTPGKGTLHVEAAGYREIAPPSIDVEPGRRTTVYVRMKRVRTGYGHVVASIALERDVQAMALSPADIYCIAGHGDEGPALFRRPIAEGREVKLGTIAISPAQKDLAEALTTGNPGVVSVSPGMTWADGALYGIAAWPGRIFRISATGELTLAHRLGIDWPTGLAFDGRRFWFLENDDKDNRFGVRAIDAQTGRMVVGIPSERKRNCGLAWGRGRLWVATAAGHVNEIDIQRAIESDSLEAGTVNRFPGEYCALGFGEDHLWGLDREAKRLCKINVRPDR